MKRLNPDARARSEELKLLVGAMMRTKTIVGLSKVVGLAESLEADGWIADSQLEQFYGLAMKKEQLLLAKGKKR